MSDNQEEMNEEMKEGLEDVKQQVGDIANVIQRYKVTEAWYARRSLIATCIGVTISGIIGIIYLVMLWFK